MSSSSDSEDTSVPSTVKTTAKRKKTRKTRGARRTSPKPKSRSRTPTKAEKAKATYLAEELEIPEESTYTIKEGWNNPIREVAVLEVKDKRSDDGKTTMVGRTIIYLCSSLVELQASDFRLGAHDSNTIVLIRPVIDPLIRHLKEEMAKKLSTRHGECPSRDEGLSRSMAMVSRDEMQRVLLHVEGVEEFHNSDWQGEGRGSDPFFLQKRMSVFNKWDDKAKKNMPLYVLSVEIPLVEGVQDAEASDSDHDVLDSDLQEIEEQLEDMGVSGGGGGRSRRESERRRERKPAGRDKSKSKRRDDDDTEMPDAYDSPASSGGAKFRADVKKTAERKVFAMEQQLLRMKEENLAREIAEQKRQLEERLFGKKSGEKQGSEEESSAYSEQKEEDESSSYPSVGGGLGGDGNDGGAGGDKGDGDGGGAGGDKGGGDDGGRQFPPGHISIDGSRSRSRDEDDSTIATEHVGSMKSPSATSRRSKRPPFRK